MSGRKRVAIVLGVTALLMAGTVIAIAATSQGGSSPDRPSFAQDADGDYIRLRDEYENRLRGLDQGHVANPTLRSTAVTTAQRQEARLAQQTAATGAAAASSWTEIGPDGTPTGQALDGSDILVSGRVTAIAVDPTNTSKVYVGTAQGGVWRSLDGGASWTPIFDSAQSLSIGALALAPSNPHILYVGTGESNLSLDSFFGVGLYRIDNVDTTATLVGPINPSFTFTCPATVCAGGPGSLTTGTFTGRSISRILVSPTDAGTIFVATSYGGSGLSGSAFDAFIPPLGMLGLYRSTNATAAAGSINFQKLAVATASNASLDTPPTGARSISDMTFVNGDPNVLVAGTYGLAASNDGGIFRSTNALAPTPTFTQTFTVQSDRMSLGGVGNTLFAASDETTPNGSGVLRESTDGGVTWSLPLAAANGFCGAQCWYDIVVAVDPNTPGPNYRIFLGGSARGASPSPDGMKLSTNGGATFTRDDSGLHADTHAIVFDSSNPATVWVGNDGGIWKRSASASVGSAWTNLNHGLGTLQFQSLSVGRSDPVFGIGGTQDNGTELQQSSLGNWAVRDFGDGGYALVDQSTTSTSAVTMYHTYFNRANSLIGFARTNSSSCATKGSWSFRGFGNSDPTVGCNGDALGAGNGIGGGDATEFYAPMALGPGTPNTVYFGTDRLYRSTNKGDTMSVVSQSPISPNAPITTIGISRTSDNVRIVGLQDGEVWETTTGSSTLTPAGFTAPANADGSGSEWIGRAVIDPSNSNTAYLTLSYYTDGGPGSNVWKTTDLSALTPTWTPAATGIPNVPVNAFVIDPNDPTHLFAGTDIGVYASTDSGASWAPLGTGLPAVAVFDMAIVQPGTASESLRIATHGRSMWQIPLPGSKQNQTITFAALPGKTFGDPDFAVSATASSGLPVSFSASGNCTVAGSTVHVQAAGSCTITASQAGDANSNAASDVSQTFAIAKAAQTITFPPIADHAVNDPDFDPAATASSGLLVTYTASGQCTIAAGLVRLSGVVGTCTVTASQAGNGNYNAALDVSRTFSIGKLAQTIAFAALPGKTFGDPDFAVGATATSGLPVSFAASGNCTIAGATVHIAGAGSCTITASQAGDATWAAAADVARTFGIAKAAQAITFGALPARTFGDADFAVGASASSGLPVSFSASGSCTVSGSTVHISGAGSCTITASQAGSANFNAAVDLPQTFAIAKAAQTITFPAIADKTASDADFDPGATASSGLPVSYSASGQCTIVSGKVHLAGGGSCTVTASQAGNTNFNAAADVSRTFSIGKLAQSIAFPAITDKATTDADFDPGATASSGLAVGYGAVGQCSIVSGKVHIIGGGSCTVTASQPGDATYAAAADVSHSFAIKAPQTITFPAIANRAFGAPDFDPGATASSGLAVSYSASGQCTIVSGKVRVTGVGSCTVTASQPGDSTHFAAPDVAQTFAIAKGDQSIAFASLPGRTFGDPDFAVSASASSGLPVSFSASGNCTVSGGSVHITGAGSCTVTASQAGNANFNAAPDVPQAFAIAKASQTITFAALSGKTFGDADFAVSASASSGLPVSFSASGSCTVSGSTVHITGAGSCALTASQAGNANFDPALDVSRTFAIARANETIAFPVIPDKAVSDPDFDPGATASSGLAVSYSASGQCTIVSGKVHLAGGGSCTVTASQVGNTNFNAATDVSRTFSIGKLAQSIAFPAITDKATTDADFDPGASASSGLPVSYAASGSCTIVTGKVHLTGTSQCTVTASQPGDATYAAAADVSRSFAIEAPQTITFPAIADKVVTDADFAPGATASSGLPVSYSASGQCTVVSGKVHVTGVGSCTVTASQPGDATHFPAPDVMRTFAIGKASQTITFPAIADTSFGAGDFAPAATASSGLPVSYSASGQCAIVSGKVHLTGAGSCTVTASQPGNPSFNAAADVSRTFAIGKASQTITFPAIADTSFGAGDFAPGAAASSGLPVSYSASGQCTVVSGKVHITGAGSCTVTASQPGDANYNAAADAARTFAIAKGSQTITFPAISDQSAGAADFDPGATASSGLPVSYAASGQCSIVSGKVHVTGGGSCTVTASQAGNANYNAAASASRSFTIKSSQSISFGTIAGKTFGDADFAVSASASSGLPVSFSATGNCTVSGATVHLTGAGSCTVSASQGGDSSYFPAPDVSQTFVIAKAGQTVTFAALGGKTVGDADFAVSATASSGLSVAFSATGSCTVTGATVHITGAGSCTVTASQSGNANYNAAASVSRTFTVAKAAQSITLPAIADSVYGSAPFAVSATASSGLPVTFAASGSCTVAGSTLTITGAGSCTVTASQAGDANYDAAAPVSRTFVIAKAAQTITFAAVPNKRLGDPDFTLTASASSGLPVTFTAAGKCKLVGGGTKVHLNGVGSCTITASQGGNANYGAAPSVSRTFTIAARLKPPSACRVPNVTGMTLANAKKALAKAHCAAGKVTRSYSSTVTKGRVMSQSRAPGTVLGNEAKVDLVLSRGKKTH